MDYLQALDDTLVTIVLVAAGYCVRVAHERWPAWTHAPSQVSDAVASVSVEPIDAAALRVMAQQIVIHRMGHGHGRERIQAYLDRKAKRRTT